MKVDFSKNRGKCKPMHAVNNGAVYKFKPDQRITNLDWFKQAEIPFIRNHDASFCSDYGGEHTVDVHAIFPDFSKDAYEESSYDFAMTDEYLRVIELGGGKTFYRLGSKIEHGIKKYGTLPPPDFKKWAVICEHIIRHYTQGWANGFTYDIEYWEIWNEPDLDKDDSDNKRTWGGTALQFFELYKITATHLKKQFPQLKIGGPASSSALGTGWNCDFLDSLGDAPLDFFSWHKYACSPDVIKNDISVIRNMLDEKGFTQTESILNEWNYVKGWEGEEWIYSLKTMKSLKAASFIAGTMCVGHYAPIDMLMYYDARPMPMNGMFNTDFPNEPLKGYFPFWMYSKLYKQDYSALCEASEEGIYACAAASNDGRGAIMLTYYEDTDTKAAKTVEISIEGINGSKPRTLEVYRLDENNDARLVRKEKITGNNITVFTELSVFGTELLLLE